MIEPDSTEISVDIQRKLAQQAYLVVAQNNTKKTVKIKEINEAAAALLGRTTVELLGLELREVVGEKVAEALNEYLEYEDEAYDLDDILKRVREFKMKHHNGEELLLALQIIRDQARDENQWFRMIIKDERRQIKERSLLNILKENLTGVQSIDDVTGLPNMVACQRSIEVIQNYAKTHDLTSCLAILRIDRHEKNLERYGKNGVLELLKHVASCCKSKFREDDHVFHLNDYQVGLVLTEISHDSARIVLNRLRWFVGSHRIVFGGKSDFSVTISVAFMPILPEADDVLSRCLSMVHAFGADERNLLTELKG